MGNCSTCIPMPGCVHGECIQALECICKPGYSGGFCDIPTCDGCINGYCMSESGWEQEACDVCRPYWECPNQGADSCNMPNECLCSEEIAATDVRGLCNHELLVKRNLYG